MAVSTMHGILKGNGLRAHQVKTFKVSRDPRFDLKVRDVVGLHVNPPDHAVVLSVDEKPRRQAPGSTRRSLPMTSDHAETRTRDYRRHSTSPRERSSAGRSSGTARRSFSPSSTTSRKGVRRGSTPEPRCTSFSTTCRRTGRPRSASG